MKLDLPAKCERAKAAQWVKHLRHPPFDLRSPTSQRAKQGVRYERKVHQRLLSRWGLDYFPSPWFAFGDGRKVFYFQPDGLLFVPDPLRVVVVEVKYQHTPDAYWQLEQYYLPLLRLFFARSGRQLAAVEVCKWYDPATVFPRQVRLLERLELAQSGDFGVHILNRPDEG